MTVRPKSRLRPHRRVVVITGGSRGLGRVLARAYAETEAAVWCLSRSGRAPRGCEGLNVDVCDPVQLAAAAGRIRAAVGPVDLWINNAGGGSPVPFATPDFAKWEAIFALNFMGTVHGCRAALPVLRRPGAVVINMASLAGLMAPAGHSAYAAAKAAVLALTRALAVEYAAAGIRFNAVAPGPLRSAAFPAGSNSARRRVQAIPTHRLVAPAEVVAACRWLSAPSASLTGHTVILDGGAAAAGCYV